MNQVQVLVVKEMQKRLLVAHKLGRYGLTAPSNTCPQIIIEEAYLRFFPQGPVKVKFSTTLWPCSKCVDYLHLPDDQTGDPDPDITCPCYRKPDFEAFMELCNEIILNGGN